MPEIFYVVDDDKVDLEVFRRFFEERHLGVKLFATTQELISSLDAGYPDVLIIDYNLIGSRMTCEEVIKKYNLDIPIIVVTTWEYKNEKVRRSCLHAGATFVRPKEDPEELLEIIYSVWNTSVTHKIMKVRDC